MVIRPERMAEPMRVENRSVMSLCSRSRARISVQCRERKHHDALDEAELALSLLDTHRLLKLGLFVNQVLLATPIILLIIILVVGACYRRGAGGGDKLGLEPVDGWRSKCILVVDLNGVLALGATVEVGIVRVLPLLIETGIARHVDLGEIDVRVRPVSR